MAREYARIRLSIADDEEFEELLPEAQWLYLRVLLPDPSLNYAGIADWRPNRLINKARGIDANYILTAAADLEERRYALFDVDTEEVLIRTYIRVDELLRNPKMAVAVVSGYQSTASKVLRAFIVSEIQKAKEEQPDYSSWTHEISKDELARLLTKSNADSVQYTNQIQVPITNRITNTDLGADYQSDSVQIPSHLSPSTSTPDTSHLVGAPSGAKPQRGSRLPSDWMPPPRVIDEIKAECPNVDLRTEHKKFVDYWTDKTGKDATKLSWEGTWRNWMRNAKPQRASPGGQVHKLRGYAELANEVRAQEEPDPTMKELA